MDACSGSASASSPTARRACPTCATTSCTCSPPRACARAARRFPPTCADDERLAAAIALSAGLLMRRVRAATDATIIVMKGPEAAARWPQAAAAPVEGPRPARRGRRTRVQAALLAAGFVEVGDPAIYEDIHHLRPLALPELPLSIEVHMRPKWPTAATPTFAELAEAAVPERVRRSRTSSRRRPRTTPCCSPAHAWEHDPLSRIGALVDVAAMTLAGRTATTAARSPATGVSAASGRRPTRAIERCCSAAAAAAHADLAPPPRRGARAHRVRGATSSGSSARSPPRPSPTRRRPRRARS